jgi:tetratricopeptide (TPR) repeat protein
MHIQAALGMSLMFAGGSNDEVSIALNRSLAIAAQHGDALTQLKLLSPLRMFHSRLGDFITALHHARSSAALAQTVADPAALALAHSMLGNSLYIAGDLSNARIELEAALAHGPGGHRTSTNYLGFDGYNMARVTLAGIMWLQGHPVQAQRQARQSVCDAAYLEHPVTLSVALIWAIFVFLGTGDLQSAEEHIDRFISNANTHSLGPYPAVGCGFKGQLAIRLDDPQAGVESLQVCLAQLHAMRYELLTTPFSISLIEGLAATDRVLESVTLAAATIRQVEARGDLVFMPELLRLKGKLLLATEHSTLEAESCFQQSLMLSRQQGALAWELRTAMDLATLLAGEGRSDAARALLQPVFERHHEGAASADWRKAARLLGSWGYPH